MFKKLNFNFIMFALFVLVYLVAYIFPGYLFAQEADVPTIPVDGIIAKIILWVGAVMIVIKSVADLLNFIATQLNNPTLGKISQWIGKIIGWIVAILDQLTANSRPKDK